MEALKRKWKKRFARFYFTIQTFSYNSEGKVYREMRNVCIVRYKLGIVRKSALWENQNSSQIWNPELAILREKNSKVPFFCFSYDVYEA